MRCSWDSHTTHTLVKGRVFSRTHPPHTLTLFHTHSSPHSLFSTLSIILVKELLQYKMSQQVPVCLLKMRSLPRCELVWRGRGYALRSHLYWPDLNSFPGPRLSAATPMYDMLKLFQTGRSHMAVLTQPQEDEIENLNLRHNPRCIAWWSQVVAGTLATGRWSVHLHPGVLGGTEHYSTCPLSSCMP